MKRLIPASCLIILALVLVGSASAQSFSGFYIGAYAGGSTNNSTATTSTVFSDTGYFASSSVTAINALGVQAFAPEGITGGGRVGWNFQRGHFVFGPELDFGSLRLNVSNTQTAPYPCCAPSTFSITQSIKTRGLFTARARAGFALHRLFFYGTGGVAVTNLNYQEVFTDTFASATENGGAKVDQSGWVGGGGVEVAVSRHFSMLGEYLYIGFGSVTNTDANLTAIQGGGGSGGVIRPEGEPVGPVTYPQNPFTHSATLIERVSRFGINFRF